MAASTVPDGVSSYTGSVSLLLSSACARSRPTGHCAPKGVASPPRCARLAGRGRRGPSARRHPALQEPRLAHLAGFKQSRTTPIHSVSGIHRKRLTPGKMRDHTVPADGCQVAEHLSEAVVRPAGDRSFALGLGLVGREGRQRVAFGDGLDIYGYISRFPGSRNAPSSIPKDKNNACSIGIVA